MPTPSPRPLDETTLALCHRLGAGLERVIRARVEQIIDTLHAMMQGKAGPGALKRKMRQADRGQRHLLRALSRQFLRDVEKVTRANLREGVRRERKARAAAARAAATGGATAAGLRERRPRRRPVRPPPPPLDPEQIKRDAETQRLRALLRPAAEESPPPPPVPVVPAPAPAPAAPTTPGGFLRALEREIQDAVPFLGQLGPERCGAQIAAWAGQVRELRDRLAPETSAAMRPAFRIFLEHLIELRAAMDAHFVDALEPKWHPPSWADYVEVNHARAQNRPPALDRDRLQAYHRAMLRALVMPHRKNVREQALPVIAAAAMVLPDDDGLLRSARRRHSEKRTARDRRPLEEPAVDVVDEPLLAEQAPEPTLTDAVSHSAEPSTPAETEPFPEAFPERGPADEGDLAVETLANNTTPPPPDEPAEGESEFERPWTK